MQVGTEQSFSAPFVVNLGYGVGTESLGPGKRKLSFMKFNSLFPELRSCHPSSHPKLDNCL